ncbi:CSS-motif domain-containing protein [Pseudomonas sp. X10]
MSKISHAGRSLLDILLPLAVGLAPVACGLLVIMLQLDRKLDDNARISLQEAHYAIDRVLATLQEVSARALYMAGRPCDEVIQPLRVLAMSQPNVRSLVLTENNTAYCSTVLGGFNKMIAPEDYLKGRLHLIFDSLSSPGIPVLALRMLDGAKGVLATANSQALQAELLGFQDGLVLVMEFDDDFIWAHGDSQSGDRPDQSEHALSTTSFAYGYTIRAGYPRGHAFQELRQSMFLTIPSLALVGLLTSAFAYWGLFRKKRPASTNDH